MLTLKPVVRRQSRPRVDNVAHGGSSAVRPGRRRRRPLERSWRSTRRRMHSRRDGDLSGRGISRRGTTSETGWLHPRNARNPTVARGQCNVYLSYITAYTPGRCTCRNADTFVLPSTRVLRTVKTTRVRSEQTSSSLSAPPYEASYVVRCCSVARRSSHTMVYVGCDAACVSKLH